VLIGITGEQFVTGLTDTNCALWSGVPCFEYMTFIYLVFEFVDYDQVYICLLKKLFSIMSIFYCLPFSFYSCIKFMRSLIEGLFCIELI